MSIESVMPSNHLILCRPFLLLPSIFPSIGVFLNELALRIRWSKYWSFSFSISPSNEYSRLRNRIALIVNKRVQNAVVGCNLKKRQNDLFVSKANHSTSQNQSIVQILVIPLFALQHWASGSPLLGLSCLTCKAYMSVFCLLTLVQVYVPTICISFIHWTLPTIQSYSHDAHFSDRKLGDWWG